MALDRAAVVAAEEKPPKPYYGGPGAPWQSMTGMKTDASICMETIETLELQLN